MEKTVIMGYHLKEIEKGIYGEASKIREECEEFLDAHYQECKVMELVELSDIIGAIAGFLANHHGSISVNDLCAMAEKTRQAFSDGSRI